MKKTILITSVGSLVAQNMLDTLEGRRERLRIIGCNSLAAAGGNFRCDTTYLNPETLDQHAHRQSLIELIKNEAIDIVIPGRDEDVLALAQLREAYPNLASRLMVGSLAATEVMDDKIASCQFASQVGLPFAETVSSDDPDARVAAMRLHQRFGFPLIAKPRKGNGSRGIRVLTCESHLEYSLQQPGLAIQPMLDAPKLDLDLAGGLPFFWAVPENRLFVAQTIISPSGEVGPVFCALSCMVAGRCESHIRYDDPEISALAQGFASTLAKLGWRGPFNLQLKRDAKHGVQAIEMNGRFTGGTSARYFMGFDEVGMALKQWLGEEVLPPPPALGVCVAVSRALSDLPLLQAGIDTLNQGLPWHRSY